MNFDELKNRLEAADALKEKEAVLWRGELENAKSVADRLETICMRAKNELTSLGIEMRVLGKRPYLRVNFKTQKGLNCLEVRLVYTASEFRLITDKNGRRVYGEDLQLTPEITYDDLENYIEQLLNKHL